MPTTTTPPPVEARSLGEISRLADDPPLHQPDFELSFRRKGLLLWIVRVPDSKDIILTTIHPVRGARAATAAEIEGCFFYLHFCADKEALLIRRHPGEGAQGNVARILWGTGGKEEEVSVEMVQGGYGKFLGPGAGAGQRRPVSGGATFGGGGGDSGLTRAMYVEGVGFWGRMKARRGKGISTDGGRGERTKKKRDYVFDGLWTDAKGASCGRCEFKDEAAGKYLKCKYYPASVRGEESKSTLLSVIEFKPSALGHRRSLSTSDDGKQKTKAKLGMLIVHGPGQEMLDLLVAANMVAFLKRIESWEKGRPRSALGI